MNPQNPQQSFIGQILDPRNEIQNNPDFFQGSGPNKDQYNLQGAAYNTLQGAGNFIKSLGQIPGQIAQGVMHPSQGAQSLVNTIENTGNYVNNLVGQPVKVENGRIGLQAPSLVHAAQTVYNDPFQAGLTAVGAKDIASGVANKLNPSELPPSPQALSESLPETPKPIIPTEEINAFRQQYPNIPTKMAGKAALDSFGTSKAMLEHIKSGMTIDPATAPSLVTGAEGLSSSLTKQIVNNIKNPVQISDAGSAAEDIIGAHKTLINGATKQSILDDINRGAGMDPMIGLPNSTMNATEALQYARDLEATGAKYGRMSTYINPNLKWEYVDQAYNAAADSILNNLNDAAVAENAVGKMNVPEAVAEARKISPLYAQQVQDALNDPTQPINAIRTTAKPFVRFQKMMDISSDAANSTMAKASPVMTGPNINGIPIRAADIGSHILGIPGRIAGQVADKFLQTEVPPNDFSQPWGSALPKQPGILSRAINGALPPIKEGMQLAAPFIANNNNQQQNGTSQQTNPSNKANMAGVVKPINNIGSNQNPNHTAQFTVPDSISQITIGQDGTWGSAVPDPYHVVGSDQNPILKSGDQARIERNQLQTASNQADAAARFAGTKSNLLAQATANSALQNFDVNQAKTSGFDQAYKDTVKGTQIVDQAKSIVQNAPVGVLNGFKIVNGVLTATDPQYSNLANILNTLSKEYPQLGNLFQPGQTNEVLNSALDQGGQLILQDYYSNFKAFGGNQGNLQTSSQNVPTSPTNQLPATPQPLPQQVLPPNPLAGDILK